MFSDDLKIYDYEIDIPIEALNFIFQDKTPE